MKNKHTSGQWVSLNKPGTGIYKIVSDTLQEICETQMPYGNDLTRPEVFEQGKANAKLIAAAPELLQMVYDLKQCIKRLTQDDLSQFDRDTEAQWEGEAHELLTRINPDYYTNANAATT